MYRTRSATEGWPQSGCRTYMFCRVRVARQCPNNSQSLLCTIGRRWAFCGGWATWSGLHIIVEWATYNRRSYMARGMNPPPNLPCHPLDRVSKSSAARPSVRAPPQAPHHLRQCREAALQAAPLSQCPQSRCERRLTLQLQDQCHCRQTFHYQEAMSRRPLGAAANGDTWTPSGCAALGLLHAPHVPLLTLHGAWDLGSCLWLPAGT